MLPIRLVLPLHRLVRPAPLQNGALRLLGLAWLRSGAQHSSINSELAHSDLEVADEYPDLIASSNTLLRFL